uniref:Uncharacterized protein n=1 Tax=Meloidogyne enterolobii TaxID=390850 RepID=A0A6V7WAQ0_MELEN|nr:unnamed protein product [Meloidogyne enterolobii]
MECYQYTAIKKKILRYYYNILHAKQQTSVQIIPNYSKNMFVIWHLFGIARNLICSFLLHYSQNKPKYDRKFSQHQKLISVISYIRAFDYLELKAKNWMGFLRGEGSLHGGNVVFNHEGLSYTRPQMLMSLQEAEQQGNIIILYPVQFIHVNNNYIFPFTNFLIDFVYSHDYKLTRNECITINIILGGPIPQNIGFYNLYDNPYVAAYKQKIDILIGENLNELFFGNMEYLPENSIDLPKRFNFVAKVI